MALNLPTPPKQQFDILGWLRRLVPFSHFPFRANQRDGTMQQIIAVFATANVDTTFTISLGRVPSCYVQGNVSGQGGSIYNGSNQGTDWTPTQIVLRAVRAGTYYIWVG